MLVERPRIRLEAPDLRRYKTRTRQLYRLCLYTTVALLLSISGCASLSGGQTLEGKGIRAGFETIHVGKIAILPFVTSDTFSMSEEDRRVMLDIYEESALARLEAMGFETTSAEDVLEAIEDADKLADLSRLRIDRPLPELFEPGESEPGAIEDDRNVFLREVAALMEVDTVLVGQVVYHTHADCDPTAGSKYTPHVVFAPGEPSAQDTRVPCAVSHFEAKLIKAATGHTIWYNRAMREVRAPSASAQIPDALDNAQATVSIVITDKENGLKDFVAARSPEKP